MTARRMTSSVNSTRGSRFSSESRSFSSVFKRMSTRTGGKSYFAKTWQKQVEAFENIREDLGNSYTITYYPQPNPNEGFRKLTVEVLSDVGKKYRVQVRPGYKPKGGFQ